MSRLPKPIIVVLIKFKLKSNELFEFFLKQKEALENTSDKEYEVTNPQNDSAQRTKVYPCSHTFSFTTAMGIFT